MKFTLNFDMDNAAFKNEHDEPELAEIQRILRNVNRSLSDGYHGNIIKDINGNSVGNWNIEPGVNDPEYLG